MTGGKVPLVGSHESDVSTNLVSGLFLKYFSNPVLSCRNDAALLHISGNVCLATNSYIMRPPEFPGGTVGSLAVYGGANNVAMLGARPEYLSCAFVIEEGFELELLRRVAASMAEAAADAEVRIVAGDTRVAPKGGAGGLILNTACIGRVLSKEPPQAGRALPGDAILVSGGIGEHGAALLAANSKSRAPGSILSDCAALNHMAEALVTNLPTLHVLKDLTRGGLAHALLAIAGQSGVDCELRGECVPVGEEVGEICAAAGISPLHMDCAGRLVCILPEGDVSRALDIMRFFHEGQGCARIGTVMGLTGSGRLPDVFVRKQEGGKISLAAREGAGS